MKVVRMSEVPRESAASRLFTSEDVTRQPLAPDSTSFNISIVNFGAGVRNKFHTHESDQILIVTAGRGIVATDKEQREVAVGDVIFIPSGEKHWHGAVPNSEFSHITVTLAGSRTTQLEE